MQASTSWDDVAFSSTEKDRHLGIRPVSQLNTWPVVSPVNASRRPSRDAAHHSGSGRMASPYPIGDFYLLFFASFPGALRVGSNASIWPRFGHVWSRPYSRHGDKRFGLVATGPEAAIEPDLRARARQAALSLVTIHVIQHAAAVLSVTSTRAEGEAGALLQTLAQRRTHQRARRPHAALALHVAP